MGKCYIKKIKTTPATTTAPATKRTVTSTAPFTEKRTIFAEIGLVLAKAERYNMGAIAQR